MIKYPNGQKSVAIKEKNPTINYSNRAEKKMNMAIGLAVLCITSKMD